VIAGFEAPSEGAVRIGGEDMARKRPYERNVGLLFQHYALFPHMSVGENVAYGLRHRGFAREKIPARVTEMLELVKLGAFAARMPGQLSGGQQQRVALARALATSPRVVLLDEPLSALDAKLRQELRTELKAVLATVGSTAIVVTHDQEEAMSLGERVFIMNRGRIVQQGTPDDIYARPQSRFVAEFMGRSVWFSGLMAGPSRFETSCGHVFEMRSAPVQAGDLCIRPESIDLLPGSADGPNRIAGRVVEVTLLGALRQVVVELPDKRQIEVLQTNRVLAAGAAGDAVTVNFAPEACVLVPHG